MQAYKLLRFTLLILIIFLLTSISTYSQFGEQKNLVKLEPVNSQYKAVPGQDIKINFNVSVAETWHINSNKPNEDYLIPSNLKLLNGSIDTNKILLKKIIYPGAKEIKFEFSENPVSVFEDKFTISAVIRVTENISPGRYPLDFSFHYQACNNSSCLPPASVNAEVYVNIVDNKNTSAQQIGSDLKNSENTNTIIPSIPLSKEKPQTKIQSNSNSNSLLSKLESSGLFFSILVVFLGGLALNLTPCVYPLIPITIGYFGGQSEGRTGKLFSLGILYVLGMAITYSTIGVITALSGSVFGALLQNPFVLTGIALILIALSLSMFGVYEFQLPVGVVNKVGGAKGGYLGAIFMGLTMGIVAAPCIGPFVLGLVTYVGAKADPFYGWVMFFFLALGLGFPYIWLALFSGKIKNLPRAGFWMESVKHIFGFLLIGMALYFISPLFPENIQKYILPVFMIIAGLYLLIFDRKSYKLKGFRNFKIVFSVLVVGIAVYLLIPAEKKSPEWSHYSDGIYSESLSANRPVIIDFYADWCIPCKELDAVTFSDPRVIDEIKRFKNLKVDMTLSLSEESGKVRDKFKITGMPTILVINSEGKETHRITGFIKAEEFLNLISKVN